MKKSLSKGEQKNRHHFAGELMHFTEFPHFMRSHNNAIKSQFTNDDVEGYIFDGIDGTQMAIWQCKIDGVSKEHSHEFDEYLVVVQGEYTTIADGKSVTLKTGEEYLIPKGQAHSGRFIAGTRTVHAFGGKRAERVSI